jgi:hypothetical protein
MKALIFVMISLFVFGCEKSSPILYERDPKWKIADEIYDNEIGKKVFLQLKREKKLKVIESGWGLRGKKTIRCMHCGFQYFNEITLDEARELLVEAANLYLKTINENERIPPFLENYPFGPENIEIRIFIYDSKGKNPSKEKLQYITLQDGKFRYSTGELDSQGLFKDICVETYEEAQSKLLAIMNTNR